MKLNNILIWLFFLGVHSAWCATTSAKDTRVLSIAITLPKATNMGKAYDHAFRLAQATGMKTPGEITFYWDEVEKRSANGKVSYSLPFLEITKGYIKGFKMRPVITICPIETVESRVPKDLRSLPLDHPRVQKRFADFIRWVHTETKDMQPYAVVIGNEFDVHIAHDKKKWEQFKNLYFASIRVIRSQPGWEEVPIAIEPTFANLTGPDWQVLQEMNKQSDVIGVSYYPLKNDRVEPLSAIARDLDTLQRLYPNKKIDLYQYGYPSSKFLGSSEEKQRDFVVETFKQWDKRKNKIRIITFTWLYDLSMETLINNAERTTGVKPDKTFTEFLGSLGLLRRTSGDEKPAFAELRKQAKLREWIE